jgi:hypothetical protein
MGRPLGRPLQKIQSPVILTSLAHSFHNMTSYTIQYLQALVLSCFNDLSSNFLSSLIRFLRLIFLSGWPVLFLLSSLLLPYPDDLLVPLPLELWKDESFWSNKAFQSYNQTFISFPPWELVVVPVGTGTEDSQIRVSLSQLGGPMTSSRVTCHRLYYILCSKQKSLSVLQLDLAWELSVVTVGTGTGDS